MQLYNMVKNKKTKKIIFRVNEKLYDFIDSLSKELGIEKSELMRKIVLYFFMAYFTGKLTKTFNELKKEFMNLNS